MSLSDEIKPVKPKTNIIDLFSDFRSKDKYVKICAPMVRYSKLEFRTLVRQYDVDLCFTPMIMADSFCQSEKARLNEFATDSDDTPLIAQFASKSTIDLLSGAEMVYPYVDGIDLNCGCPQRWATSTGYGCALMNDPDKLKDMIGTVRRNLSNDFSVSVKLRLLNKTRIESTIDLCRQIERCGVSFLTIHGRTPFEKPSDPVDYEAIAAIKQSLKIPLIANGDVKSLSDANEVQRRTQSDGVMIARGILANPTIFTGTQETSIECIQKWINITYGKSIIFQCFHHHLTFMMEKRLNKKKRIIFNNLTTKQQVYDFLLNEFNITPTTIISANDDYSYEFSENNYRERMISDREVVIREKCNEYTSTDSKGAYFNSVTNDINSDNDDDDTVSLDLSIFD